MKKMIFLVLVALLSVACSKKENEYEKAVKEIYGKVVTPSFEDGAKVYHLIYTDILKIDKDARKLKNKMDKIVQQVGQEIKKTTTESGKGVVTFYNWETPNVVVVLITQISAIEEENHIRLLVDEK